MIIWKTVIFIC